MMEKADADGDGRVTSAEAANFRAEQIASYDTDGDGKVTEAEMAARFNRMLRNTDSDGDGALGQSDRRGRMGQGRGMGPMMQDDTSEEN